MKTLLTLTLVVLMAGFACAQDVMPNSFGMFFAADEFTEANTNVVPAGPFNAYIVLCEAEMASVGAYELGIDLGGAAAFALTVEGPNGWTNFGGNFNHLAGFQDPLPTGDGWVVLSTMQMLYSGADPVNVVFGAAEPSSVDGAGPAIADGNNPDIVYTGTYTSGPVDVADGVVATFLGDGIVFYGGTAVENMSLSNVKALFN